MKITVIGCGRWGSLIAWYLDSLGHKITLYGRSSSKNMQGFLKNRKNSLLVLPESVLLSCDFSSFEDSEVLIISIDSQNLRPFLEEIKPLNLQNKIFVLCMKGIEISTGFRLSEVAEQNISETNSVAVWLGPGHVQEFYRGIPNCMVIDSKNNFIKTKLVNEFSSGLIRFYYGEDLIGNELGAAAKNVIGIAAGMLDGLNFKTLKGALMSRGTREVARLIKAMGGNELSAYGLCHLGDYEATVFSEFSHNRKYGETLITGEKYESLAEGYYTVKALINLSEKYNVELPITSAVYKVIYENENPQKTLGALFDRSLKNELN